MQDRTKLELELLEKQEYKQLLEEWQKIDYQSADAGRLGSDVHLELLLKAESEHIDKVIEVFFNTERSILTGRISELPENYFIELQDEIIRLLQDRCNLIRSKTLQKFEPYIEAHRGTITKQAIYENTETLFIDKQDIAILRMKLLQDNVELERSSKERSIPLVFISYDTRDIELANAVDDVLKRIFADRVATFIAKRDIKAGDNAFQTMLHDSLAKSALVIALCTRHSLTSPWLWFESGAGFGCSKLIPVWAGIKPQEFKAPMTIFQGRNIEDKSEVEDMICRIAEIMKIPCDDNALTTEEFDKLVRLSTQLRSKSDADEKGKIEDIIKFPLSVSNDESPVEYLIEAHFPLSKPIPIQRLYEVMDKSKLHIKGSESHFSYTFPDMGKPINNDIGNDILLLNAVEAHPFSNEVRQFVFVKSDALTLTYWLRHYRLQTTTEPNIKLIEASAINDEGAKLLFFYQKIALTLGLTNIQIRIRLFGLQNGLVNRDQFLEGRLQSYRAPASNEVEIEQQINSSSKQDISELLMHVWEKFRTPAGQLAVFKENDFMTFLAQSFE